MVGGKRQKRQFGFDIKIVSPGDNFFDSFTPTFESFESKSFLEI
jgi:hypothetical protein